MINYKKEEYIYLMTSLLISFDVFLSTIFVVMYIVNYVKKLNAIAFYF